EKRISISQLFQVVFQPRFHLRPLAAQGGKGNAVLVPPLLDEPYQLLSLLGHGGIEASLHVLREEFEDEVALLVVAHRAAAGLEFAYKGIGQGAVTGAGGGEVGLDLFVGREFGFNGGETVKHRLERSLGCTQRSPSL